MAARVSSSLLKALRLNRYAQGCSLLPFLYETRTLQGCHTRPTSQHRGIGSRSSRGDGQTRHAQDSQAPIRQAQDQAVTSTEGVEEEYVDEENARPSSTITKTERQAFARIFEEIISTSTTDEPQKATPKDESSSTNDSLLPTTSSSPLDSIFQSAIDSARQRSGTQGRYREEDITGKIDGNFQSRRPGVVEEDIESIPFASQDEDLSDSQVLQQQQALMRYPESLRAAAARAIGFRSTAAKNREEMLEREGASPEQDGEVEVVRQQELKRVEDMLTKAGSGVEVLNILERELFPQLSRLENPSSVTIPKSEGKKKKRGRPRGKTAATGSHEVSLSSDAPGQPSHSIPPLAILGVNYPHLLLLATRLLRNTHNAPTLALSLFARIKSLSSISYVLGATTAFYNEILKIRWYDYRDFWGVDELLLEMERGGVAFDVRTEAILRDANLQRRAVERGDFGHWRETLWAIEGGEGAAMRMRLWGELVKERINDVTTTDEVEDFEED